jgi:uncharacterized protein (DUF2236 family)
MIRKWLHNKKLKNNPMCPCGWRMKPATRKGFDHYWNCLWDECTWEAFVNGTSTRVKFWKS